jgi:transposase, IS30 family
MPKGREITFFERERIESYLRIKKKKTDIAKILNRDYSVIKREIKRNSGNILPYAAITAQKYADRRRKNTNKRKLEKLENKKLVEYVEKKLEGGWSPEQIDGRLKEHPPKKIQKCRDKTISYESIYDYIYNGQGRFGGLYQKLRRKQCQRKRRFSRKIRPDTIKNRVSINNREDVANNRERFGDWETDSVIFSGDSILSVQSERKSRLCRIHKCEDKTALKSERALRKSIKSLPSLWLTIARDNGTENVLHHETKIPSYFCDKYCSWQKGGVENLNGLIREYFPKRSNLDIVSKKEIYLIQEKLNNRPRKCLNYLTPNEVIAIELEKGALNS